MHRLAHQPKEAVDPSPKPHDVRRAIRYRAADNARQAIRRQFPQLFIPESTTAKTAKQQEPVYAE